MKTKDAYSEAQRRKRAGAQQVTMSEYKRLLAECGYRIVPGLGCISVSRIISGDGAGSSFPARHCCIVENDTGKRCFQVDARRDANYRRLIEIRDNYFVMEFGRIVGF